MVFVVPLGDYVGAAGLLEMPYVRAASVDTSASIGSVVRDVLAQSRATKWDSARYAEQPVDARSRELMAEYGFEPRTFDKKLKLVNVERHPKGAPALLIAPFHLGRGQVYAAVAGGSSTVDWTVSDEALGEAILAAFGIEPERGRTRRSSISGPSNVKGSRRKRRP